MDLPLPVFVIAGDRRDGDSISSAMVERLVGAIHDAGLETRRASSFEDGLQLTHVYTDYGCILLDWALGGDTHVEGTDCACPAHALIQAIRARGSERVPIFLLSDKAPGTDIPDDVMDEVQEFIHLYTDTPSFIAGRVKFAVKRYADDLLPPYFKALRAFVADAPYYWDCPGHMGGVAYLKHPVGAEFHRFFGENIMRADVGVMASPLGDWLSHRGPPAESEENAARIFGADRTYYVVGGSSLSNQIVAHGTLCRDDLVIVDRNCHKSLNHALTVTHATPLYLNPKRNGYALLGLIPRREFEPDRLAHHLKEQHKGNGPRLDDAAMAIVTNSTYDGLCYKVKPVTDLLAQTVPRIHYDEAWYAYAAFHDLYAGRFGMEVDLEPTEGPKPLIFTVHSTHKMLAAFSMASMIHVKNTDTLDEHGEPLFDHGRFNEAFMMHGTTSPFYPIIASIDVAAAMMEKPGGPTLVDESLDDAIDFRRSIASVQRRQVAQGSWFFGVFQPPFPEGATNAELKQADFWTLQPDPGPSWHGFKAADIEDGHCLLDPTKVTVLCPGIDAQGNFDEAFGIPAKIVARFLDGRRISIAKNGDYTILLLVSIGTSKGKWGTLREALVDFKRLHDAGASVAEALPALAEAHPEVYGVFDSRLPTDAEYEQMLGGEIIQGRWRYATLEELCSAMHGAMQKLDIPKRLGDACDVTPDIRQVPGAAYQELVKRNTREGAPREGDVSAGMIVPYPPGIPILMPGEAIQAEHVDLFRALEIFGRLFPGFEPGLHGISRQEDGHFEMRLIGRGGVGVASTEQGGGRGLRARFRPSTRSNR